MAITLPNGKICRSLPEQVAANLENIEAIAKILDGLNVHDNVVVIDDITVPLTADELEIVRKEVAFLVYQGQVYLKKTENSTDVYFDLVFSITGTTVLTFNSKEIDVVISTGALTLTTNSVSTYSKLQLDNSLALKADLTYVDAQIALCAKLAGANFTGPITASSIIENMSGYSFTKPSPNNATLEILYAGAVKNGNKLTLVINGYITPTGTMDFHTDLGIFTIPQAVSAKLVSVNIGGYYTLDAKQERFLTTFDAGISKTVIVSKVSTNKLYFTIEGGDSTFVANAKYYFRKEITFLLSDSLAS